MSYSVTDRPTYQVSCLLEENILEKGDLHKRSALYVSSS